MKLNERITLDKYIPYSSHIHPTSSETVTVIWLPPGSWAAPSLNVKTNIT
jgi:hypothetical protein